MTLIIEQRFPLGRFHATRWKQGNYGDAYGEWPPSPYRLLRALFGRWFQYAREQGWGNEQEEAQRKQLLEPLLKALADVLPSFYLPENTARLLAYKHYQPVKRPARTLVADECRALPPEEAVLWFWQVELKEPQRKLLENLLARIVYFGRAESFCRMELLESSDKQPNCTLSEISTHDGVPVLAPIPGQFSVETLKLATGDAKLENAPLPPGTRWFYAHLPQPQKAPPPRVLRRATYPSGLQCVQFAVGGRVFPPMREWVRVTERFRGRVIKHLALQLEPTSQGKYERLSSSARGQISLMAGKNAEGRPLTGHQHAYFLLWPDVEGVPRRLVVYRREPFNDREIAALLAASEIPLRWDFAAPQWLLRLVPLPFDVPPPDGLFGESDVWRSLTPFVAPANRHRFRKNGRARLGESLDRIITKLVEAQGLPLPSAVHDLGRDLWVYLHETRERRKVRQATGTPWVRPGRYLELRFKEKVRGPLILGDSSHFGLGLFVPADE